MVWHVKLDLRQAQISAAETHIHARALFGNIDLLVPEGVEVELQAGRQVGRTKVEPGSGIPGAPRIVLTGGTFFGDVKVRRRRRWEKLVRLGGRTRLPWRAFAGVIAARPTRGQRDRGRAVTALR